MVDAPVVLRGGEEIDEILQTYENLHIPKRGGFEDRQTKRIEGWPEEKNQDDNHLGGDEEIRQDRVVKNTFFHYSLEGPLSQIPKAFTPLE